MNEQKHIRDDWEMRYTLTSGPEWDALIERARELWHLNAFNRDGISGEPDAALALVMDMLAYFERDQ